MIKQFAWIAIAAAALLGASSANANDIVVREAWSRATPKGAKVAAGYLTIENRGIEADRLMSASSAAAPKVEIHQMATLDGIMTMRPLENGLVIPPDSTVTLEPGGNHIMFVELVAPFEEGQRIAVDLKFERAGTLQTVFDVGSVGAKGPRMQIATTDKANPSTPIVAPAPPPATSAEPFFTHLCGTRVMANVTVTPGRSGPVEVLVQLEDGDEKPLSAEALSVTLSNPDANIAPATAVAERVSPDSWRVQMTAAARGKWSLSLGIDLKKDDRVDIAAPILIE
ncbi:MAG TPA: copper chaperone PCu(A)C [Bradyrhizobium sp.]|uniref:copper chaperone PCu(A)C n=1 Tax=Bradyrhizobium sp. TaxID=376 RepID=UPI002D7FEAE7|nr:copper chaperone PCu(A)C [Bradyrhizobium sp.]HET7889200.1 copper chaperone PCu(A)C [Bradyrhizobium sp.]